MSTLLPRLTPAGFERHFQAIEHLDPTHIPVSLRNINCEDRIYGQTGGTRLPDRDIEELVKDMDLAYNAAKHLPSRKANSVLDQQWTRILVETKFLDTPDATRDEFWCYLASAVLPDLVIARFGINRERFAGGVRNCFQRLWRRGQALVGPRSDHNRWQLVDSLTEDAFVAIFERTRLSPSNILCREIAAAWLRASDRYGRGVMEDLHRQTMKAVSLIRETQNLECLADSDLSSLFDGLYEKIHERTKE